ncbi:MAG: hypothetical protein HY861_01960 [Chlamydiia bacterium]|nr:hypothetical protein [Chlamydiia bacterium]
MSFPDAPLFPRPKKLLIITSSAGGGLIQAANAKEQEALVKDPTLIVIRKDVLTDWMDGIFGKFCVSRWNSAQMKGNVAALRFFIAAQYFFDYLCWPYLFCCALYTLFKEDIDQVIDTQPMGTSALIKALRIYHLKRNKKVCLQKVLVDLPTKAATHFFRSIKDLTKKDRPYLNLITIAPLLEEGQSAEEFWQTNCGLSDKEIHYEDVYVRQAFRKYRQQRRGTENFPLSVRYKTQEELQLMQKTFSRGSLQPCAMIEGEVRFSIPANAHIITVLLGSQPANESTFNYVKQFLRIASESVGSHPCALFVFCAQHIPGHDTLFRKVANYVSAMQKYPKHFTVVPFSFQNDDIIAPLFFRSDVTCTRSGGQTAMELMCVGSGVMWIHSETRKAEGQTEEFSLEQLLEGIPGWEAANALYLQEVRSAKIVTPETIRSHVGSLFRADVNGELSARSFKSTA